MFFSVIIGYVVAVAFAFCGAAATVTYVMEAPHDTTYTFFLEGLAVKMWPLAVALALVLLIQIACQIERLRLTWAMSQLAPAAPARTAKSATPKPAPTPAATASAVAVMAAVTPPVMDEPPATAPEKSSGGPPAVPRPPRPPRIKPKRPAA